MNWHNVKVESADQKHIQLFQHQSTLVEDDLLIIHGGDNNGRSTNRLLCANLSDLNTSSREIKFKTFEWKSNTAQWDNEHSAPVVEGHTMAHYQGNLFAFGGRLTNVNGTHRSSLFRLSLESEEMHWNRVAIPQSREQIGQHYPQGRRNHNMVINRRQGILVLFGGQETASCASRPITGNSFPPVTFTDLWTMDLNRGQWERPAVSGEGPRGSIFGASCVYDEANNRVIVHGGITQSGQRLGETYTLYLVNYTWKRLATAGEAPPSCERHTATLMGKASKRMVIFGGWSDMGISNETYELDLETLAWKRLKTPGEDLEDKVKETMGDIYRYGHSAVAVNGGNDMLVLGGRNSLMDFPGSAFLLANNDKKWQPKGSRTMILSSGSYQHVNYINEKPSQVVSRHVTRAQESHQTMSPFEDEPLERSKQRAEHQREEEERQAIESSRIAEEVQRRKVLREEQEKSQRERLLAMQREEQGAGERRKREEMERKRIVEEQRQQEEAEQMKRREKEVAERIEKEIVREEEERRREEERRIEAERMREESKALEEQKRMEEEKAERQRLEQEAHDEQKRKEEEAEAECKRLEEEEAEAERRHKEEEEAKAERKRLEEEEERRRLDNEALEEQKRKEEEEETKIKMEVEHKRVEEEKKSLEQENASPSRDSTANSVAERLKMASDRPKLQVTQRRPMVSKRKKRAAKNINVSALLSANEDASIELPDASRFDELERQRQKSTPSQIEPGDGEEEMPAFKPPVGAVPMFGMGAPGGTKPKLPPGAFNPMMGMNMQDILAQRNKVTGGKSELMTSESAKGDEHPQETPKKKKLPPGAFNPMMGMNMQDILAQRNKVTGGKSDPQNE